MNIVAKCFVLILPFYLDANFAKIITWKSVMDKQIDYPDDLSHEYLPKPKTWIIFIVSKSFLRLNDLKENGIKTYLEPYKSLQMLMEDIQNTRNSVLKNDIELDDFSQRVLGLKLTEKQKDMLRKRWSSSCDRKAARLCKKACRTSYKTVCRSYRCRRYLKRSFRRECSRNCRNKFNTRV